MYRHYSVMQKQVGMFLQCIMFLLVEEEEWLTRHLCSRCCHVGWASIGEACTASEPRLFDIQHSQKKTKSRPDGRQTRCEIHSEYRDISGEMYCHFLIQRERRQARKQE